MLLPSGDQLKAMLPLNLSSVRWFSPWPSLTTSVSLAALLPISAVSTSRPLGDQAGARKFAGATDRCLASVLPLSDCKPMKASADWRRLPPTCVISDCESGDQEK